jgi:hypothetical protein
MKKYEQLYLSLVGRNQEETLSLMTNFLDALRQDAGRAVDQTVSRWLSTAAVRVHTRVRSCGICGGQSGTGAGFLQVLLYPLPIFIPPTAPQSPSSSIWGWYNRPVVTAAPNGLSLTPLRIIKKTIDRTLRYSVLNK